MLLWIATPVVARTPVHLTATVIAAVLVLGLVNTGFAYVLDYRLVEDAGIIHASLVAYLIPVVAVVLGATLLSEPVRWTLFAGGALVLGAVGLASAPSGGTAPGRCRR